MRLSNIITSKSEIKIITSSLIEIFYKSGSNAFICELHKRLLKKKVKFPLLEFAALEFYQNIPAKDHINITDRIINLKEIGSYVLAGMVLQLRLQNHFSQSISKAVEYISKGNEWYACDIIAERVMGYALLTNPVKTIPVLKKLSTHNDKWIVRAVGVASHYAVKKGLKKEYAEQVFQLLLSLSGTTEFHTKTGIGWGAKTIAKFHPGIIRKYKQLISAGEVRQWFKTKIKIGLGRSDKYAKRYTG